MKQAEADNTPKDLSNRLNRAELTISVDHSVFIERGKVWFYDSEDTTKSRLLLILHNAEENGEDFARHNRVDSIKVAKPLGTMWYVPSAKNSLADDAMCRITVDEKMTISGFVLSSKLS